MIYLQFRSLAFFLLLTTLFSGMPRDSHAQQGIFSDRAEKKNLAAIQGWKGDVLRFLTNNDYPPFNYIDEGGALTGFNVDLARAICQTVNIRCDIQVRDWESLIPALEKAEADAVIASLAINKRNLKQVDFTYFYLHSSARFVSLHKKEKDKMTPENIAGKKIAAIKGTVHEAYLKDFFSASQIISFEKDSEARSALKSGKVDYLFSDTISLMFWLNGTSSEDCCEFRGEGFTEAKYFGSGIGIAVKKGNYKLLKLLNEGLSDVRKDIRFEQLLLRYFPLQFY